MLLAACSTPAVDGMVVQTESPRVVASRRETLELLFASGNHNCAIGSTREKDWTAFQMQAAASDGGEDLCPVWGDCRLQDLAYHYQVDGGKYSHSANRYPMETVNPLKVRDFSRCILCGRCVQACNENQVNRAIDFGYRGAAAKVVAGTDVPLKDSQCVFCGECIQACPTGALVEKKARFVWRTWKNRKIRTTCPYCGVGCQQWLHVQDDPLSRLPVLRKGRPTRDGCASKAASAMPTSASRPR